MMLKKFLQRISSDADDSKLPLRVNEIEDIIEYNFKNKSLLVQAFKHRSFLTLNNEESVSSNERLEFLGDAILDLIVTEHLYNVFPDEKEGDLSKKKSVLVSRQVLGSITESLNLGAHLLINKGEEKTGGRKRLSNLANLFEAILGAIYLDGGLKNASAFVEKFLFVKREELLARTKYFNYKSSLLEYSQAHGWGIPLYQVVSESGPDHDKYFEVLATADNHWKATGKGRSKKKAEQIAAKNVLRKIKSGELHKLEK
ncbi:MAG: ribonuclease III [Calditrichaceae bacterium]|nr:ribonuclease III [Calditrichaceae bacterium]